MREKERGVCNQQPPPQHASHTCNNTICFRKFIQCVYMQVERVVLDDGEVLAADFVVVGAGVTPVTDFIKGMRFA